MQKDRQYIAMLAAILISFLVCCYGIFLLIIKPGLPFPVKYGEKVIVCSADYGEVKAGDTLLSLDGFRVSGEFETEYILDRRNIGETIYAGISRRGEIRNAPIILVREYKNFAFIIITFITGFSFWLTSGFVFLKKPNDKTATTLSILLLFFSYAIMTSPGKLGSGPVAADYFLRITHIASYIFGIAYLIKFIFCFSDRETKRSSVIVRIIFGTAAVYSVIMGAVQYYSLSVTHLYSAELYNLFWKILISLLAAGVLFSFALMFHSFLTSENRTLRTRLQWPLWGISAGVFPYIILYIIPIAAGYRAIIPEEYSLAFLIIIPASFAIGVIRYRMLDIEVIFRRSIIYSSLSIIIISVYFALVFIFGKFLSVDAGGLSTFYSLIAAFSVAVIFNPLRLFLIKFVDRTFYRVNYDFKKTVIGFSDSLLNSVTLKSLYEKIMTEINNNIPVSKIGIIAADDLNASKTEIISNDIGYRKTANADHLKTLFGNIPESIISLPESTEHRVKECSLFPFMRNNDIDMIIPMGRISSVSYFIIMGSKLSGLRYSDTDIELLLAMSENAALAVSKLSLSEKLLTKEIEAKKLEDLNRLKSDFISGVSHELKTPLTSIRMFAETLSYSENLARDKQTEYAEIIKGESERLDRLIDNILNFSRIERGIKIYNFENTCLNEILESVLSSMEYHFRKNNVILEKDISTENILIKADSDAVKEALINIISNAIKYSPQSPVIGISMKRDGEQAVITVNDNGIGIGENDCKRIFENFYRIRDERTRHIGGTGIGLSIVKDIMEHHEGKVEVSSIPGKGSRFSLYFKTTEN